MSFFNRKGCVIDWPLLWIDVTSLMMVTWIDCGIWGWVKVYLELIFSLVQEYLLLNIDPAKPSKNIWKVYVNEDIRLEW